MAFLLLQAVLAEAGEYALDKKENNFILPDDVKEICADYVKNLNRFNGSMVCDRKTDPGMTEFSKPEWESIDPVVHPELLDELARFWVYEYERREKMKKEYRERKRQSVLESFTGYAKKKQIKLSIANFDIDNDGKEDRVLHFQYATEQDICEPYKDFTKPYLGKYMLLEGEKGFHINEEMSHYIFLSSWNIFQYKSATFFDLWTGHPNKREAEIQVYYPKHSTFRNAVGNTLICRIKFKADEQGGQ